MTVDIYHSKLRIFDLAVFIGKDFKIDSHFAGNVVNFAVWRENLLKILKIESWLDDRVDASFDIGKTATLDDCYAGTVYRVSIEQDGSFAKKAVAELILDDRAVECLNEYMSFARVLE